MSSDTVAPARPTSAEADDTRHYTILTVDDEPSVLSALRRLFRLQGWRSLQAESGAEGLDLLDAEPVDLVISDMRMPVMDGARFLELARERHPGVARLLLTGYADISATIAAINRGEIHRYITKPWDDHELLLTVRDALSRRELERRHAELLALTARQNEALQAANRLLESRVAARTAELEQLNRMLETSFEDLDRTFMLTVNVFSGLLEMREGSAGHARRVATLARATAARLGLGERECRDVYLGGLLHDVGKIGFPDRMLGQPVSTLSAEDKLRYNRHTTDGETALMPLAQLQAAARIVRQHHERVDGRGFPDGLAADAISLGARIVAAVNDYDGLLHGALAEQRQTPERARQMLRGGIGTHYDARVVEALLAEIDAQEALAHADRLIDVRDLRPGMTLGRDLLSPKGAILLAAGYVFDQRVVRQVCDFANREGLRLMLHVRQEPAPPPPHEQAA